MTIKQIVILNIEDVFPDPNQPRDAYEKGSEEYQQHTKEVAADIKARGLDQAIQVRPHPDPEYVGKFMIVTGETRWQAKKMLQAKDIEAIIRADLDSPKKIFLTQISENAQRKNLNTLTQLRQWERAQKEDWLAEAAVASKTTMPQIKEKLKLLALPTPVLIAWEQKKIPETVCFFLLKKNLPEEQILKVIELIKDKTAEKGKAIINAFFAKENQESLFVIKAAAADNQPLKRGNSADYKKSLNDVLSQFESAVKIMEELSDKGAILTDACGKKRCGSVKGKSNPEIGYDYLLKSLEKITAVCTVFKKTALDIKASAELRVKKAA